MSAERGEFRRIGERSRLEVGFFSVVTGTFVGPDGFTFERDIVRHSGAVCVVPLEADRKVVAVRQYRSAIDRHVLEIPAGKMDVPGEVPLLGARRELAEEVGMEAGTITALASFFNSPGFTDEKTYMFLGEDLIDVGQATEGIEEQYMTIERFALDDIGELVMRGEIIDGKTIVACYLALDLLAGRATGGDALGGAKR